jgi:hypothetical protein
MIEEVRKGGEKRREERIREKTRRGEMKKKGDKRRSEDRKQKERRGEKRREDKDKKKNNRWMINIPSSVARSAARLMCMFL